MRHLQLGASLYVPATRADLVDIGNGVKYPQLRSVIFCTEDAVRSDDLPLALANLERALRTFTPSSVMRFVRVRNPSVLRHMLGLAGVDRLTGFVIPKATRRNLPDYLDAFGSADSFLLMLTLESAEVFDPAEMAAFRNLLLDDACRPRLLSLRIGGNDLLQLLGLRRPRQRSIYATPLGPVISQLVATFRPHGINLTAPVFEMLGRRNLLARETRRDLDHGLFGKSAIHPAQVAVIESQYAVDRWELIDAETILAPGVPSVFRLHDAMCEPATHHGWAQLIRERARLYGVRTAYIPLAG